VKTEDYTKGDACLKWKVNWSLVEFKL